MVDFNPDAFLAQPDASAPQLQPSQTASTQPDSGFDPDAFLQQSDQQQYDSPGQTFAAGVEGAARGVLGPLATAGEKFIGVPQEDILGRQQAHPVAAGAGEALGLGAGMLTGTGEAALMAKAGELGLEGLGLASKAGEAVSLGHKIGSAAVQQAIEMGVLTGSDETSKLLLNDPNTSAESAIMNTGIGAVLGAGFGAATTGIISPLWKATAGPKVEEFLNAAKSMVNGESALTIPKSAADDLSTLGITPSAVQRADLSDSPTINGAAKNLVRSENTAMLEEQDNLRKQVAESVVSPLGTNMEDLKVYDNDEAGRSIAGKINDQIKTTFEPLWKQMDQRNAEAALYDTTDASRMNFMDQLRERGVTDYAPNSPHSDLFYEAGERQLNFKTLADYDKYDSELRGALSKAQRGGDFEEVKALSTIRGMVKDYKNQVISYSGAQAEEAGLKGARASSEGMIADRQALNQQYAKAETIREELGDHFNISSNNSRQFMKQLNENMTPEAVLKKFSIKNNSDGAAFLQKNFPDAFDEVVKNERRAILKPALNAAKGESPIDINKLNTIIEKAKGGKDSYLKTILPQEFLDKAQAGARILGQMTNPKNSGTPAGLLGMLRNLGGSALGAVGFISGHGFASSAIAGELASRLGTHVPEALQLGMLKWLGSTESMSAPGMKSLVDFAANTYKGQNVLTQAVKNTLKPGAMVIAANNMPSHADRIHLDKQLAKVQNNPAQFTQNQASSDLGHYAQEHQTAMTETSSRIAQYLQNIKPKIAQNGILDNDKDISKAAITRYQRAQDIALNPAVVLNKIKSGTLQVTDIQDLNGMYPGLQRQMIDKLTSEVGNMQSKNGQIPYKTRMSLSLFIGQPLDSTMQPMSIQAAQMALQGPQQAPSQQKQKKPTEQAGKDLQKGAKAYQTSDQAAESDRSSRD